MARFPDATPILKWCDFELHGSKVEIKECMQNAMGRYYFKLEHHDQLVDEQGMYFFALKRKKPNQEPKIHHIKWMPACIVTYDEDKIEQIRNHATHYEWVETFRIHWKQIWPELLNNGTIGTR
jgi:hypothetical protein